MVYLLNRLGQTVLVVLAASLVGFALFRYAGDPVNNMVGQAASLAEREAVRRALGLDDPVPLQFLHFAAAALRGELGVSYRFGQPVAQLLRERFPATIELSVLSMLAAVLLGLPLGVWTALHRGRALARLVMGLSLLGVALPTFLIGLVLILVFSVWLGWLPAFGRGDVVTLGGWSTGLLRAGGWRALALPCLTLGLFQLALILRVVRAEMLEALGSDYIRFGRACGLRPSTLHFDNALRNTMLPVITIIGLQFGNVFAFSIIVETVFQWPGLGLLVIQAIQFADIPLLAGYIVMVALAFALINLAVDLAYAAIDPRIRTARRVA